MNDDNGPKLPIELGRKKALQIYFSVLGQMMFITTIFLLGYVCAMLASR